MFSIKIDKILKRNEITKPFYIGCFASDQIPLNYPLYPYCAVVNIDRQSEPGSHWISIYVENPTHVEYFDPLGYWPPPSLEIFNYLQTFPNLTYNKHPIQSENASSCGKHAIYFLHKRCSGLTFDDIIKLYRKCNSTPDHLVNSFLYHLLNI